MSSNEQPIAQEETMTPSYSVFPDIVLTADNGEQILGGQTLTEEHYVQEMFIPGTELWDLAQSLMAGSTDTSAAAATVSTLENSPSQGQMQLLPSAFEPASGAPSPSGSTNVVSPQHASLHAMPLSYSPFDKRYWDGFEDGFQAASFQPTLPAQELPPVLRGRRLSYGTSAGVGNLQQPAVFGAGTTGIFTAPTTPLDPEVDQGVSLNVNAEDSLEYKIDMLYSQIMPMLANILETLKNNENRIQTLSNSIECVNNALQCVNNALQFQHAQIGALNNSARNDQNL